MSAIELKKLLEERKLTVSFAESCTGGLISYNLTSIPGASSVFRGSIVAYSDDLKERLLKVDPKEIQTRGAVSEEVVTAMARSVREVTGSDLGVAVSGIAGPDGGNEDKPVGLVYLAASDGRHTICERRRFPGDREDVRRAASERALAVAIEVMEME